MAKFKTKKKEGGVRRAFAQVAPGLEEALAEELRDLGCPRVEKSEGGVYFAAEPQWVAVVNLYSRIAARVLVVLGRVRAPNLDSLYQGVRLLPWKEYVHPGQPVNVVVASQGGQIRRRNTVQSKVEHAINDALRGPRLPGPRPPRTPVRVVVTTQKDRARVSIDTSGDLLHRRGWRKATAKAPMRENLAAAMLRLTWEPGEWLVDPMCGSGTFSVEAAHVLMGRAPGANRTFAWETFPGWPQDQLERLRREAGTDVPVLEPGEPLRIWTSDRNAGAVEATTSNASRAGVSLTPVEQSFSEVEPPADTGLVVLNPPYGARIKGGDPSKVYRYIGRVLRERWGGWRVAVLLPDKALKTPLGLALDEVAWFSNGGLPVWLLAGEVRDSETEPA